MGAGGSLDSERVRSPRVLLRASSTAMWASCCLVRSISSASALSLAAIISTLARTRLWRFKSASSSCARY